MRLTGRRPANSGNSLIEFALVIPLLFLLFVNVVNFGGFFYGWITVANAARAGANYRIQGPKSLGFSGVPDPPEPSYTQVTNLVTSDVRGLRNAGSVVVRICRREPSSNTTIVCEVGAEGDYPNPPPDSRVGDGSAGGNEGELYHMVWVDVVYTYQPPFAVSLFGIPLTLGPSTTMRRQSVMRIMR